MVNPYRRRIESLIEPTGIQIDGPNPWDIQVLDERFYARIFAQATVGFGESYVDGWWECEALDEMFCRLLKNRTGRQLPLNLNIILLGLRARFLNRQNLRNAFIPAKAHYDLGNDVFRATFDERITGSCGYWINAKDLDSAQEAKHDLICRKIDLKSGDRVLDIGCGWGAFMKFAAERYGVECVGVTVSKEQVKLGEELCRGLPVTFLLDDYRNISGKFDHIVSMGMFEHVGGKNYQTYMKIARDALNDRGLFLLHTIGSNITEYKIDPWIDRYIFPNGVLPSVKQIGEATEKLFVIEDWHNFGADYDRTLMAWFQKFHGNWPQLESSYGPEFYRLWKYYLLSCAGGFRARVIQLWQIVLSKHGVPGGYMSIR